MATIAAKLNKSTPSLNASIGGPPVTMTAPASIPTHQIGDWQLDKLVAASRGKLADLTYLFWGGCLGSVVQTIKCVWEYLNDKTNSMPFTSLLQILVFAGCFLLAFAFSIINRKKTQTAEEIAIDIRNQKVQ
jgi:hypothetical protein